MIRLVRHYIDALQIRLFLIDEFLRNPSGAEDWVNLLRFLDPSFPAVAQILREHGLYPIIFQGFGGQVSNYPFERDVVFARKELLNNVFFHNY